MVSTLLGYLALARALYVPVEKLAVLTDIDQAPEASAVAVRLCFEAEDLSFSFSTVTTELGTVKPLRVSGEPGLTGSVFFISKI